MFKFPRHHRLTGKREPQLQRDFKVRFPPFTIFIRPNSLSHPRLGLMMSKKYLAKATLRNSLRRYLREEFRHLPAELKGRDIIILLTASPNSDFSKITSSLFAYLKRQLAATP